MIQKGDLSVKLQLLFKIYDTEQKGYLTIEQYSEFIKCVLRSIKFGAHEFDMFDFQKEAFDFYHRAGNKVESNKVFEADLKDLMQDSFMQRVTLMIEKSQKLEEIKDNQIEMLTQ